MKNKILPISIILLFILIFYIFYKGLEDSKKYTPNLNKIVPLQLYLSAGGDGATGNVARAINIEGYYRP